ncbi:MAG TPA: hypothetical protein VI454_13515 [Verrucomicrobiae bacterium]
MRIHKRIGRLALVCLGFIAGSCAAEEFIRIATFQADATPPLGSPLCHASITPARAIVDPLTARGVVLMVPGQKPIVLCAVDWVGIYNGGYDAWREALAHAAGTDVSRVTAHTLHQHDAPGFDLSTEELLAHNGLASKECNIEHAKKAVADTAAALREAMKKAQRVTHVGIGAGTVEQFASTRRVPGPDGKVKYVRYSSCKDPKVRAEPEGLIDPQVRLVSFWDGEKPVAVLSYYATHPQSYYGAGGVSCDTVGIARAMREKALPGVAHIHFDGAGGNVTAGKYNDGSPENRQLLAGRLATGMEQAWKATKKSPLKPSEIEWRVKPVALPLRDTLIDVSEKEKLLADSKADVRKRIRASREIVWSRRMKSGQKIECSSLRLGPAMLIHMPGELFVEYQLAAQKMRPDVQVCMAAYADGGPGYIGTEIAYSQGGYETSYVSHVAPSVERVLTDAMRELLAK